jgi:SRSO17 transposase
MSLPSSCSEEITWRETGERKLQSRFAAVRIRAAHRDYEKAEPHREERLLIEWPRGENEATKYWVSTLPPTIQLKVLIKMAKHRWIIERDCEELKQELVECVVNGNHYPRNNVSTIKRFFPMPALEKTAMWPFAAGAK